MGTEIYREWDKRNVFTILLVVKFCAFIYKIRPSDAVTYDGRSLTFACIFNLEEARAI